jgi:hypothetical protein
MTAKQMLEQIEPFDDWKKRVNPSDQDIDMYWHIKNGLEKLLQSIDQFNAGST